MLMQKRETIIALVLALLITMTGCRGEKKSTVLREISKEVGLECLPADREFDFQSTDPKDDTNVFSRFSYNFTMAIYDAETNTLYYMELDT